MSTAIDNNTVPPCLSYSKALTNPISSERVPLPTERARSNIPGQGWQISTSVKESLITGAGNGRFSNVDVPKNTIIMVKPIISMEDVSSLHSVSPNNTILFKNEDEINKFITLYEREGSRSRTDMVEYLSHYVVCKGSQLAANCVTLNFSSAVTNHGDPGKGLNVAYSLENGANIIRTLTDVKAGDELCSDYSNYEVIDFWAEFCEKEGVEDVVLQFQHF